jgi:hypothetical protein
MYCHSAAAALLSGQQQQHLLPPLKPLQHPALDVSAAAAASDV